MKTFIALIVCSLTSLATLAEEGLSLPLPVYDEMKTMTKRGTCEKHWPELARSIGVVTDRLEDDSLLMIVPCSAWTHNVSYAVFVLIKESTHEDGFRTKPVYFVDHSPYQRLHAQDVIHNVKWDSQTKTLFTHYYLNGKEQCGTDAKYTWNSAAQTLLLSVLKKQDDCQAPGGLWETLIQQ